MMINLKSALLLADRIGSYIPDDPGDDMLKFSRQVLDNIIDAKDYRAYLESIELTSGISLDILQTYDVDVLFQLFCEGMSENKIMELIKFYEGLKHVAK